MVQSEGMSLKNPATPPGIDPGTVRLVAQCLNHYTSAGPKVYVHQIMLKQQMACYVCQVAMKGQNNTIVVSFSGIHTIFSVH